MEEGSSSFGGLGKKTGKRRAFGVTLAVLWPQGRPSVTVGTTRGGGVCPQTRGASKEHAALQALEVPIRCWARCGCLMKMYNCMFGIQEASFFHCRFHSYNVFPLKVPD